MPESLERSSPRPALARSDSQSTIRAVPRDPSAPPSNLSASGATISAETSDGAASLSGHLVRRPTLDKETPTNAPFFDIFMRRSSEALTLARTDGSGQVRMRTACRRIDFDVLSHTPAALQTSVPLVGLHAAGLSATEPWPSSHGQRHFSDLRPASTHLRGDRSSSSSDDDRIQLLEERYGPTDVTIFIDDAAPPHQSEAVVTLQAKTIGEGRTGVVWRAELVDVDGTRLPVVAKLTSRSAAELVVREHLAYQKLASSGLPSPSPAYVGTYLEHEHAAFFVVLMTDSGGQAIRQSYWSDLDKDDDLDLKRAVMQAAEDLHRLGLVHHDLEPRNVIRLPPPSTAVEIIDLGWAHAHDCPGPSTCDELCHLRRVLGL